MYKPHSSCSIPSNVDSKLWRYLDVAKYISLLERSQLYFSPATQFDDLSEGVYTKQAIAKERQILESLGVKAAKIDDYEQSNADLRRFYKVSCWTLKENESNLMWKAYIESGIGLAIQSTFKRFTEALEVEENWDVCLSEVKYIDHTKESNLGLTDLSRIVTKNKCFSDETELRGIVLDIPEKGLTEQGNQVKGIFVNIDPTRLIEKVVISPYAPEWFQDMVLSLNSKFGVNCSTELSEIKLRM